MKPFRLAILRARVEVQEILFKAKYKEITVTIDPIENMTAVYDLKWTLEALGDGQGHRYL